MRKSSGYGAKLTNIYSKTFVVETVDSSCQLLGVFPFFIPGTVVMWYLNHWKKMVKTWWKTLNVVKTYTVVKKNGEKTVFFGFLTMENKPPIWLGT